MDKKMLDRKNIARLLSSIFCFLTLLILSACTSSEAGASLATEEVLIPESVNGLDRDLWPRFIELINSPDCQLPCWWGFRVGVSTEDEVVAFLQENDFARYYSRIIVPEDLSFREYIRSFGLGLDFFDTGFEYPELGFQFRYDDSDVLTSISIVMDYIHLWLPAEQNPYLLTDLFAEIQEQPTIHVVDFSRTNLDEYSLYIDYPTLGVGFEMIYNFSQNPLICISYDNMSEFWIRIGNIPLFVEYRPNVIIPINEEGSLFAGITAETFVQFFREHPNECLDLSENP
jgi:hypothetical protein